MDRAEVNSICFNQQSTFVACCSDRGTVHIFSLEAGVSNNTGRGSGMDGGGRGGAVAPDESPNMGAATGAKRSGGGALNAMSG